MVVLYTKLIQNLKIWLNSRTDILLIMCMYIMHIKNNVFKLNIMYLNG